MYICYALLKTHPTTNSACSTLTQTCLFLQCFVEDLHDEIKSRPVVRYLVNFSIMSDYHLTGLQSIANANEAGYFKE